MHQNGIPSVKRFADRSAEHLDAIVDEPAYGIDSVINALHSESAELYDKMWELRRKQSLNAIRLKLAKHERKYGNTDD